MHQENALFEGAELSGDGLEVDVPPDTGQPLEEAVLVPLGLQAPDEPGAGVGQALVIQVHGVLRREHDPEAEGPGLLEQGEQGPLGRRFAHGREVAEDLVHIKEGAKAGRPGLGSHPAEKLVEEDGHKEHPLGVGEVGDREDGQAGLARRRVEERADVERVALQPGLEPGRGQQVVDHHGELVAVGRGIEGVDLENADALEGRSLDLLDEGGEVEPLALSPGRLQDVGDEDVLPALQRVGLGAQEPQESGDRGRDPLVEKVVVLDERGRGASKDLRMDRGRPALLPGV